MASVTYGKCYLWQKYYVKCNYGKNIMANETEPKKDVIYQTGFREFLCKFEIMSTAFKHISLCRFGHLEKVQVVLDGHSGRSRGFAFVYFESVDDATEARNKMTGTDLDGK